MKTYSFIMKLSIPISINPECLQPQCCIGIIYLHSMRNKQQISRKNTKNPDIDRNRSGYFFVWIDQFSFSGLHKLFSLTALRPQFLQKKWAGWINFLKSSILDSMYPSSCNAHKVLSSVLLMVFSFQFIRISSLYACISANHVFANAIINFIRGYVWSIL